MTKNYEAMTEVTPEKARLVSNAPTPPVARTPAKVPMKMPFVFSKAPFSHGVPRNVAQPSRRRDHENDDDTAVLFRTSSPVKHSRMEVGGKHVREKSESSSDTYSDSSEGDSESSGNSSASSESGGRRRRRRVDDSSQSSSFTESTDSDSAASSSDLTFFQIAKASGLIQKDGICIEEEEELAPVGPPPRPPIVRTFPNVDTTLQRYRDRLNHEENMIRIKDDNKAVSLGTSKINYIDPRIICSWAREQNVPISRIFSATIQKKFPWAMGAENFLF